MPVLTTSSKCLLRNPLAQLTLSSYLLDLGQVQLWNYNKKEKFTEAGKIIDLLKIITLSWRWRSWSSDGRYCGYGRGGWCRWARGVPGGDSDSPSPTSADNNTTRWRGQREGGTLMGGGGRAVGGTFTGRRRLKTITVSLKCNLIQTSRAFVKNSKYRQTFTISMHKLSF